YGRVCGTKFREQVFLSGSNIDRVVNGGNVDGQFGALAAWLALDCLNATYGAPLRTVEVLSMDEEEGSRFPYVFWGSKN
ncbi:Zn-dependent hydrolase, partial [Salmonella enterica subsp. enterica serovar Infantis]